MKYIVPEYYYHFKCKCGECRRSCCDGWPVVMSIQEYYHLLGINCSDQLRTRLDCALKICSEPERDHYAQMSSDWHGICMMHREDGLCALQAELGENSLPEVCQLYPRRITRLNEYGEYSCSNGCERIIELLMNMNEPLRFYTEELSVSPEFEINLPIEKYEQYKKSLSIIQNRSISLPKRLIVLGNDICGTDIMIGKSDKLSHAFQVLHAINTYYACSMSVSDYCTASLDYFCIEDKEKLSEEDLNIMGEKYTWASKQLELILPNWQIIFEQLIVNHMFFNAFPYDDQLVKAEDTFLSLAVIYSFLRFNTLGNISGISDTGQMVDLFAAMFRLIEHSNFRYVVVNLMKAEKYPLSECVTELLSL